MSVMPVLLSLAACGGGGSSGSSGGSSNEFPVGLVTSLSPPGLFQLGKEANQAVQAFVKWNNASSSSVKFKIVGTEDDKGDPAVAREAIGRLADKGAKAIVGDMSSAIATAAQPVATNRGILYMVGGSWADELTGPSKPSAFRVGASNSGLASHGILPYLRSLREKGLTSIGLLTEDSPYGLGATDQITKLVKQDLPDVKLVNEVYPANSTDVTPQLLRISRANPLPQMIIIPAIGPARNLAIKQAHDVGLTPKVQLLAQWNWPTYSDFWGVVGTTGVGVQYVDFDASGQAPTAMAQTMAKELGGPASIWAEWAWDAMLALRNAVEAGHTTDVKKLVAAMESVSFDGASGPIAFSTDKGNYHNRKSMPAYVLELPTQGATGAQAKLVFSVKE
jgi:branched-chain amino acid transport system substrate-binding protein